MSGLSLYLTGTASWFLGYGLQTVMFSWLVTIVLHEAPDRVGLAQMALLLPGTLLFLVSGSLTDRFGGQRMAVMFQTMAALTPWILIGFIQFDELTFQIMLIYAVLMGCAQAFVIPARDTLLNQVAGNRIQHVVLLTSLAQFAPQIIGIGLAGAADSIGPLPILMAQSVILLSGAVALKKLSLPTRSNITHASLGRSVLLGAQTVWKSSALRGIAIQNVLMAICFMGAYSVTIPLVIREIYQGGAAQLALVGAANSSGLVIVILILMRIGPVARQGRALLVSQMLGALMLGLAGLTTSFTLLIVAMMLWGAVSSIALVMSRTIMQEQAPADQRGRVMSINSLSFLGIGPFGALVNGYLVDYLGLQVTLLIVAGIMICAAGSMAIFSELWRLDRSDEVVEL